MIDVDILTLENGNKYIIVDTLENKNNKYLFLVNEDDELDTILRKVIKKEDGEYVVKLDSEDEFSEIMTLFIDKHKGEQNEK